MNTNWKTYSEPLAELFIEPNETSFHPSVDWLVGFLVGLHENYWMDFNETWQEDEEWAKEKPIQFWCTLGFLIREIIVS